MRKLLLVVWLPLLAQESNPLAGKEEAVEGGRQTFLGACSACHGQTGQGGTGPSLAGQRTSRLSDERLFSAIRNGLPGSDMPPLRLPDDKTWQLVSFLRILSAPAVTAPVPGDVRSGEALFFGKAGCSNCHSIAGRGGRLGPDLSNAGATRTLLQLRESLFEPNARIEKGFEGVTVVTADGHRVEGVAKNQNNYSLQVLDTQGRLHLFWRADVREVQRRAGSLMPSGYAQGLSAEESAALLAFLSRQTIRAWEPTQ